MRLGGRLPTFTDFSELVLPSCTLFTRLGSLRLTFTYRQLLNFMCPVFIYRRGHAITNSDTNYSLLLVLALFFWWQGFQLASSPLRLQGVLNIKYPMSTAQLRLAKMVLLLKWCLIFSMSWELRGCVHCNLCSGASGPR